MDKVKVEKINKDELKEMGVFSWPIWEKEISRFDWHYDDTEKCYILEGKVMIETADGEKASFEAGDFVTFSKGLDCVWDIQEAVKKHYNFE